MPKVIEKLREELINEVRRELEEYGYSAITVRSIAQECNVGVGTVYNYFPSKDELVAAVVFEDWKGAVDVFNGKSFDSVEERLRGVYDMLKAFIKDHEKLFSDPDAEKRYLSVFGKKHLLMRKEVASLLLPVTQNSDDGEFLSIFVSEALLSWIMTSVPFEKIYAILKKLL